MIAVEFFDILSTAWNYASAHIVEYYHQNSNEKVTVETKSGPVKGYKIVTPYSYEYFNFQGIPYAKPPINELRFKDPQPFEPSTEIINEKFWRGGSMGTQIDITTPRLLGEEDCLHLSVFTRELKPTTLKPVIVVIHGGAFLFGANSKDLQDPQFLLTKEVVVFSINYRIGAMGFLSFKDPELEIPGNAGLKDQTLGLKWVNENCMHFGGDPDNITLLGESAGAASVSLHMASEHSKDLFHKAIAMSGNFFAPWLLLPVSDWPQRIARRLGWNGDGGEKGCLYFLQRSHADTIVKHQMETLTEEDIKSYTFFPFGPTVEPYEAEQCFMSKHPKELLRTSWSKDIPLLVGGCSEEGLLFYKTAIKNPAELPNLQFEYLLPYNELGLDVNSPQCRAMGDKLRKFYFGYTPLNADSLFVYSMILNDKLFAHATHRFIVARAKRGGAPIYALRFNFESEYSMSKKVFAGRGVPGVCHGDDCSYYYKMSFAGADPPRNSEEWKTMERMVGSFTAFAKTGDPNNEALGPVNWEPVALETSEKNSYRYKCLNVSNNVTFIDVPELERMQYWDRLYKYCNVDIV